jgi:BirA family transcriptional regulator, biotin operon repressor / biotin---[acetyl-CoA-carboxylase] ligase
VNTHEPISGWRRALEQQLAREPSPLIRRVAVLAETTSTQEAALPLAVGEPGVLVVAARQTAGRGRLGRTWVDQEGRGLAATFVLSPERFAPGRLSVAAGLAAAMGLDELGLSCGRLGLRWPNDVVEPLPRPGGGRKVAGVLIEVRQGLALVGIGINVSYREEDFPAELHGSAVSLAQLRRPGGDGAGLSRLDVAASLVWAMHRALELDDDALRAAWLEREVLMGSTQRFVHGGREVGGIVESIEPTGDIVLRTESGERERLPSLATSLVKP